MPEPNEQASWAGALPTSTGRRTADGRWIYRMVGPQVTWWVWAAVAAFAFGDLAIQGHDLSALRFGLGLLTITGLVFACTLWPRVVASQDGMRVYNPFRSFQIPWLAIREILVADSMQVRCARTPPKTDKTVYSWALSSPRRANARTEMRARQWEHNRGRSRPAGWDRMPASAKEIAKMSAADLIAREIAAIARNVQAQAWPAQDSADRTSNGHQAPGAAQAAGPATATGTTAVISGRWSWQPIAALLLPAAAFAIAMLVR